MNEAPPKHTACVVGSSAGSTGDAPPRNFRRRSGTKRQQRPINAALHAPVAKSFAPWSHVLAKNLLTQHAQIAEHKYCRPHARPFHLRFARVVAVLPPRAIPADERDH